MDFKENIVMYPVQKFPVHLKCVSTLPCEIWMPKTANKLALIIQSKVNRRG